MIEDRILRAIVRSPEIFPVSPVAFMASHTPTQRALLSYAMDTLQSALAKQTSTPPFEVIISVVVCLIEDPGIHILSRATAGAALDRTPFAAMCKQLNFMPIAKALEGGLSDLAMRHFEIVAPGQISSHERLRLHDRLEDFDRAATLAESIPA